MHTGSHSRMIYSPTFTQQSDFRSREPEQQGRCSVPPMCRRPMVPQQAPAGGSENTSKYVIMPNTVQQQPGQGHEQHPMDVADWEPGRNNVVNDHRKVAQQQAPAYSPMVYPMPMEAGDMEDEGYPSPYYNMATHNNRMSPEVEPCNDPMSWLNAPNSARVHFSDQEEGNDRRASGIDVDGSQLLQQQQPVGSNERI